jgi:hypothetical protein
MSETLNWKSGCEFPAVETVDRSQSLARLDQLYKLVCGFFDLMKYFLRIFFGVNYDDRKRVILGTDLVMGIRKIANDLVPVETSGNPKPRTWSREQRHVKAHSIGAIDERSLLRDSRKCLSAVSALKGVSLQKGTPTRPAPVVAGSLTEVLVNSEEATGILSVRTRQHQEGTPGRGRSSKDQRPLPDLRPASHIRNKGSDLRRRSSNAWRIARTCEHSDDNALCASGGGTKAPRHGAVRKVPSGGRDQRRNSPKKSRSLYKSHYNGVGELMRADSKSLKNMARPRGVEPPTFWFVARRSIQLSYGRTVWN